MPINIFRPIRLGKEVFHPKSYDENSFVMDWNIESGGKVPSHAHMHANEHFRITSGEITFVLNGEKTIKKSGEEFFVPLGVTHSVINSNNGQSTMTVTYSPCADTHRMFEIIATLDEKNPGSMVNMVKYFYLVPRLGLREFSTIRPPFIMHFMNGLATLIGAISGWKKMVERFK